MLAEFRVFDIKLVLRFITPNLLQTNLYSFFSAFFLHLSSPGYIKVFGLLRNGMLWNERMFYSFVGTSQSISIALPTAADDITDTDNSDGLPAEAMDFNNESKKPLLCWFDGLNTQNIESEVATDAVETDDYDGAFGIVPEVRLSRTRMNAVKLARNGDYAEAVDEKIRAVALVRIIYGDNSVQLARVNVELGEGYLKLRRLPLQAIKHAEEARNILLEIESSRYDDSIASENRVETAAVLELIYFVLGKANKMLKKYKYADNFLQKANLVQRKKASDCGASLVDKYKTLETLVLLGEVSRLRKQYGHAMEWFEKAVELIETHFGSKSGELVGLHHQIGKTELQLGKEANFERVYESYEKARIVASAACGKTSSAYADSCACLANAYITEGNRMHFASAETALDEAILIYTKSYGKSHRKTLEAEENLCRLLLQGSKYKEAEEKINLLIKGKTEKYGEVSEPAADAYKMLGGLFLSQNKFKSAVPKLMKCKEIYTVVLGPQSKKTKSLSKVLDSIKRSPASNEVNIPEEKLKERPRFNNSVSSPKSFAFTKSAGNF